MKNTSKIAALILFLLWTSQAMAADVTTYHFGAAERQLSSATDEVADGAYCATDLHAVDTDLAAGNIKSGTTIFGITGTLAAGGGTNYGLPKTGQQPGLPAGTPFYVGDDCSYASPESHDVGYPCGTGSWGGYNAARFTDHGDGTVTDNATGLMWEQKTAGGSGGLHDMNNTYTWADAFDVFIAGVNAEGGTGFAEHNDWRLPNCFELGSILDLGRSSSPSINPIFVNAASVSYWSSTTSALGTGAAWYVYFYNGYVKYNTKFQVYYVRAVRGGE
jgi:hypothetical protein